MFKKNEVRLSSLLNSLSYTLSVKANVDLRGANSKTYQRNSTYNPRNARTYPKVE